MERDHIYSDNIERWIGKEEKENEIRKDEKILKILMSLVLYNSQINPLLVSSFNKTF